MLLALLVVVVITGFVAAGHILSTNQVLSSSRSADVDAMQTTAEGLIDFAYASWRTGMKSNGAGPLTYTQANALVAANKRPALPSWMTYKKFTIEPMDASGSRLTAANSVPVSIPTISQNPKGWRANVYQYLVRVVLEANTVGGKKTVAMEGILRHDSVPPVGGLFYTEGDFELYKPAPMIIDGPVFTNEDAMVSTHYPNAPERLRFLPDATLSHVGPYNVMVPPGAEQWSAPGANDVLSPTYDRGSENQVFKTDRMEGIGMGTAAEFNTTDNNPNNDGNRELIEPPVAGHTDPPGIAASRIYNNAGLIIEIAGLIPTGTPNAVSAGTGAFTWGNVTVRAKNGTSLTAAKTNSIISALSNGETETWYNPATRKNENRTVQRKMYDKREATDVLVSDVNVTNLSSTLNTVTGFNNILYVHNTANVSGPKGIRLLNGGTLPTNGLTLGTEGGVYVRGDYNTGMVSSANEVPSNANPSSTAQTYKNGYVTKPAAIAADAIMFLSNSWNDANDSKSVSNRPASNTTVNTAIIAGYIPSLWKNPNTNETYWYSGGANNFPRFLENWSGDTMTFNGAFVQLYKSKMFIGEWNTGDIYSPPNRRWTFDKLLLERVIPGIPAASSFDRGQLRPIDPKIAS